MSDNAEQGKIKYGVVIPDESISDFDPTKKIKYADKNGFYMADEANKDQLEDPEIIQEDNASD